VIRVRCLALATSALVIAPSLMAGQERGAALTSMTVDGSAETLVRAFDSLHYRLDSVRASRMAPRIFLEALPGDMHTVSPVQTKTSLFIRLLLPLTLEANARTAARRDSLKAVLNRGAWTARDSAWVRALAEEYRGTLTDRDDLLARVDAVPPSLALAQGADESAWGTSRFAREGNALFGEHTHGKADAGLVAGSGKKDIEVEAFPALLDGVLAYMHNLNSNPAYQTLRDVRARERAQHEVLSGSAVAEGLKSYSARGEGYVQTLQSIIRAHELHALDSVTLRPGPGLVIATE